MITEGEVRQLLAVLKGNLTKANTPLTVMAFSGGVNALEMVLEESPANSPAGVRP